MIQLLNLKKIMKNNLPIAIFDSGLGGLTVLKELNQKKSMTVILAMHDLHLASKFCNRLILLEEGKIFKDGKPEEVLLKEHLEKVYGIKVHLIRDHDGDIIISPETLCMQ